MPSLYARRPIVLPLPYNNDSFVLASYWKHVRVHPLPLTPNIQLFDTSYLILAIMSPNIPSLSNSEESMSSGDEGLTSKTAQLSISKDPSSKTPPPVPPPQSSDTSNLAQHRLVALDCDTSHACCLYTISLRKIPYFFIVRNIPLSCESVDSIFRDLIWQALEAWSCL